MASKSLSVSTSSFSQAKSRPRANSLLSIWYGIIIGILQVYLIYQSIRRFVWFTELSWPYQKTPFIELNIYIALIGVAVLMLPFFLAASFLRIGNTANDNGLLGRHLNLKDDWAEFLIPSMLYQGSHGFFRTIWTHSGPTSSLIHVISSFCLLLPQTVMEAVLIKFGHLSRDALWNSDMDFMVSQKDRDAILKILSLGEVETKLMSEQISPMHQHPGVIRVEFFNYALALFVFAIRYSNVYWFTNKSFSIVFSIQLILSALHSLVSFFAFSILYKLHVFGPEKVLHKNLPFLLNHHITLLLYTLSIIIILASSSVIYHYGYVKIASFVKQRARAFHVTDQSSSGVGWAYFPHCSALAVLLALTASQSSLIHDATLLYRLCLDTNLLSYIVSVVVYMLLWIFTWLVLTVKSTWSFQLNVNVGNLRMRDLDSLRLCAEISLASPSDINKPSTPLVTSMLVINEGQAFEVSDLDAKRNILEKLLQNSHLKRETDSSERIYWPRSCPVSETQNSLEPEEQPWLRETPEVVPSKHKVTFQDDLLAPRRYATTPTPRSGTPKGIYREISYTQPKQCNIDDGDYALLKRGKLPMKHCTLPHDRMDEKHTLLDMGSTSSQHQQRMIPMEGQLTSMIPNIQGVPRSTDSGYHGTESSNASCSDSRSTASSNSPPDRSTGAEYLNGTKSMESPCCSQVVNCGCESQQLYSNQSTYGKIGMLNRRDSIRSHVEPIYETKRVYDLRHVPMEGIYGENAAKNSVMPSPNRAPGNGNEVAMLRQEREYSNRTPPDVGSNNQILNNSDYGMTIHRRSSIRRSFTHGDTTTIQTTPYGRCTNIKLNPVDQMPPVPPPLPPLSFLGNTTTCRINSSTPLPNNSCNSPRNSSSSFATTPNYSPHHATIPRHNNLISPSQSNTCSPPVISSYSLK